MDAIWMKVKQLARLLLTAFQNVGAARPTFASVTTIPCTCHYLERKAEILDSPIHFDTQLNEYHFNYLTEGGNRESMMIYHCPWCGGTAPKSKRALMFAVIQTAERLRLDQLLEGVRTVNDALTLLGAPDHDWANGEGVGRPEKDGKPPAFESYRTLHYTQLSATVDVIITDTHRDKVRIRLQGKYIGPRQSG